MRHSARATESLANELSEFDKTTSVDGDTTPSNDPDHDGISDFSRTTHENTGLLGVPAVFATSVSRVSHGNVALQRGSQESAPLETVARPRERGEREGSAKRL